METDGFLTPEVRDLIGVIGVVGTLATFVGLLVAVWQILKTKRAAEAARDAIANTLAQTRKAFGQYALSTGRRLLSEAKIFFDAQNWSRSALRLSDLAEQAAQLAQLNSTDDTPWPKLQNQFRQWEATCRRLETGELEIGPNVTAKWHRFTRDAAAQLDAQHGPFAAMKDVDGSSD